MIGLGNESLSVNGWDKTSDAYRVAAEMSKDGVQMSLQNIWW